jgi:hypothetical protein
MQVGHILSTAITVFFFAANRGPEANFFLLTVFRLKASLVDETGAVKIHLMKYKSPLLVAFVRDGALGFLM